MLERRVLAGKAVEIGAGEHAHPGIGQRGYRMAGRRAEGAADEIGRIDDADDLLPAIVGAGRELEDALDHIGHQDGVVAFPDQRLASFERLAPPDPVEPFELRGIERAANRLLAHGAGIARGHRSLRPRFLAS